MIRIIKNIIYVVYVSLIVAMFTLFVILPIFNKKPYIIISNSMSPHIPVGSMVWIDKSYKDIEVGDVIAYSLGNGKQVTHRVVEKVGDRYVTKGDNNEVVDNTEVTRDNIIGKKYLSIAKLGYVINSIKKYLKLPYFIIIGAIMVFYISYKNLFKKEK